MSSSVHLVPVGDEHLADLGRLWNDPDVMRWIGFPDGLGVTTEALSEWLDRVTADPSRHSFVLLDDAGEFCGEAYYAVDRPPVTAGLDIKLVLGAQGRGIATKALEALIALVFEIEPTVEAVWTEPSDENAAAQRLYRRCGLAPERRPAHLPPGPSYWARHRPA